jgi:hypothetical protein
VKRIMKRSKQEAEVIVRLDFLEKSAHICVAQWPAMAAKMERLYGRSLDANSQQSCRWAVPIKAISFRRLLTGHRKPSKSRLCFNEPVQEAITVSNSSA